MRTVQRDTVAGMGGALIVLAVLAASYPLGPLGWLVGLLAAGTTNALLAKALRHEHLTCLHTPNRITLARAMIVAGVAALVADDLVRSVDRTAVVTLATVALVLDAVDGYVARRTQSVTVLGARFDMEVDAFLILVLSGCATPLVGGWVLCIGGARYAYVAAGWVFPWLRSPVPPRYWRKVVAATQGVALTVVAAQLLPVGVGAAALGGALALLAESFGRDVWWQYRAHQTSALRPAERPRMAFVGLS